MTIEVRGEELNLKFKLLNWKLLKHGSSHLKNTGATYLPYQHNLTKGRRLCYPKIFGKMPAKQKIIIKVPL